MNAKDKKIICDFVLLKANEYGKDYFVKFNNVYVGGSQSEISKKEPTQNSDLDLYIFTDMKYKIEELNSEINSKLRSYLYYVFGISIQITLAPKETLEFNRIAEKII
tara:strand:- start:1915 stop:2235 length:321 start_codon:yes stop_codon:yes gene_type:complete